MENGKRYKFQVFKPFLEYCKLRPKLQSVFLLTPLRLKFYQDIEIITMYFSISWFHQRIDRGAAAKLLQQYNKGNGSFLVRESQAFVGDFSITFW